MRITASCLNIPPFISVAWKDILSLHTKPTVSGELVLVVELRSGSVLEVPSLSGEALEKIFLAFSEHHEQETPKDPFHLSLPLQQNNLPSPQVGTAHNPKQANLPDLPPEMLNKIGQIAKVFGLENPSLLPEAEKDCNCMHCQVVRSLRKALIPQEVIEETEEEEISFSKWTIEETSKELYVVTDMDTGEKCQVFLGNPLGCTCGEKNCEHLKAVLST